MKLQTTIPLKTSKNQFDYDSEILLVGSCFVENIAAKLEYYKFKNQVNPFGILFHPEAIARFFEYVVSGKIFTEVELLEVQERFVCLDAHSDLSGASVSETLKLLNAAIVQARIQLEAASHVIITLGTAWGYRHKTQDKIVANCHKIPQREFDKELATVSDIEDALRRTLNSIQNLNSKLNVLFTISPVRHIKDGFIENQRSKAHLLTAVHSVIDKTEQTEYFPSYEIVMDELRDYRFYKRDLIHPNELAVAYIWECFISVYVSEETHKTMQQVEEIQRGLAHKPFNANSEQHQKFLKKLEVKKSTLQAQYPQIRF
ncbi:GSCFA domain-containing protein [Leeuwenhoekiella marinoflava]|uniref:GSCFA domain-containing protein n=1 Tax=Leeuwenhoekiella marinoflava TaxID=988 RepID=UPI003001B5D1